MEEKVRGSAKMGVEISEEQLASLVAMSKESGIELLYWWRKGQPAIDWIGGTYQVDPRLAGKVVDRLLSSREFRELRFRVDVFPYGIPAFDRAMVAFISGGGIDQPFGGMQSQGL